MIVVPMSTLRPVVEPVAERDTDGALVIRADPPPRTVVDFVKSLRATGEPVAAIRFDEVLDRELLPGP